MEGLPPDLQGHSHASCRFHLQIPKAPPHTACSCLSVPGSPRQPAAPFRGLPCLLLRQARHCWEMGLKEKAGFVQFICSHGERLTRQRKPADLCQAGGSALPCPGGESQAGWLGNRNAGLLALVLKACTGIKLGAQPQKAPTANAAQTCCSLEHSSSALAKDGGRK